MTVLSSATVYGAGIGADVVYRTVGEPINTFLTEIAKTAGPEIGQDIAEVSEKLKDVFISWLEGYIERPDEVSFQQIEFQKELNIALLPDDFESHIRKYLIDPYISPGETDIDIFKKLDGFIENIRDYDALKDIDDNRRAGDRRESEFKDWLEKQYGANDGYIIEDEVYLRDKDGNIVKDPVTGEARRVDFVVIKDGKVIKSYEVTSPTAPKEDQMAKEARIRENGGNYIRDEETAESIAYDDNVKTEVVRLA